MYKIKVWEDGEPINKNESQKQEVLALSVMQEDINEILSKNINIGSPVTGVITSKYGARDEIFKGVEPYHTGIDIANKLGTPIHSATDGVVIKVESNNKYYGNNVLVQIEGIIFKYAHMSKISVKEGETISQGTQIGLMGSTGMSTGSHLHFEIKINGRTVDPQNFIKT
ncbi:MAG: M23 family metallopeptidase [Clostridia bacterium]